MNFFSQVNWKNIIKNGLLLVFSIMICLIFAELAMRWVYPRFDPRGRVTFKEIEKGLIIAEPNFLGRQWRTSGEFDVGIEINKYGFRDKRDLKESTSKDIFILGDSFGFGHGVEEVDRFGNILDEMIGEEINIYNLSLIHI